MFADQIPTSLIITVVTVALLVGTGCMVTSNVVWFKKQIFGIGGGMLSFCGLVLIGLSVWGNVQFEGGGITLNLQAALRDNPELADVVISRAIEANPELGEQFFAEIATRNPGLLTDRMLVLAETNPRIYNNLSSQLTEQNIANFERLAPIIEEPENGELLRPETIRTLPTR